MIEKRILEQERREQDEKEKKVKANLKVMSKIAFKEWNERKKEEERL